MPDSIQILDTSLKHGFVQIPRAVLRAKGLSASAKTVYAMLLDYAWQEDSCFPGQERLADDLGTSVRTIQRYLTELTSFGLIDIVRRGFSKTNIYRILSIEFLNIEYEKERTRHKSEKAHDHPDATNMSHHDTTSMSHHDTTPVSYYLETDNRKQINYKQPFTLENVKPKSKSRSNMPRQENVNEKDILLDEYDPEAIEIAKELGDMKSLKYYQKLIHTRDKGRIHREDIDYALCTTKDEQARRRADKQSPIENMGAWFVGVLAKRIERREKQGKKKRVADMLETFHMNQNLGTSSLGRLSVDRLSA